MEKSVLGCAQFIMSETEEVSNFVVISPSRPVTERGLGATPL